MRTNVRPSNAVPCRFDISDGSLGRQEASQLQEGVRKGIPPWQEGYVPLHLLGSLQAFTYQGPAMFLGIASNVAVVSF